MFLTSVLAQVLLKTSNSELSEIKKEFEEKDNKLKGLQLSGEQLRQELQRMLKVKQRNEIAERENRALYSKLSERDNIIQKLEREKREIESRLTDFETNEIGQLRLSIQELQEENDRLSRESSQSAGVTIRLKNDLQDTIAALKIKLEQSDHKVFSLEKELGQARNKNQKLQQRSAQVENQREGYIILENRCNTLKSDCQTFQDELEAAKVQISLLKDETQARDKSLNVASGTIANLEAAKSTLEETVVKLELENRVKAQSIQTLEESSKVLGRRLASAEAVLQAKIDKINELEDLLLRQKDEHSNQVNALEDMVGQAKKQHQEAERSNNNRLAVLEKMLDEKKNSLAEQGSQLAALELNLEQQDTLLHTARADLENSHERIRVLEESIEANKEGIRQLQVEHAENLSSQVEHELASFRQQLETKDLELRALKSNQNMLAILENWLVRPDRFRELLSKYPTNKNSKSPYILEFLERSGPSISAIQADQLPEGGSCVLSKVCYVEEHVMSLERRLESAYIKLGQSSRQKAELDSLSVNTGRELCACQNALERYARDTSYFVEWSRVCMRGLSKI
mmetsp:Transcript_23114/g.36814  ORF Transcript_23114/g.36814 Transcript_23114/m.36814 type:complete len:573 (+) Transcript_23114:185-1903(+)